MMGNTRTPLQGLRNIIRFNWPFYVLAIAGVFAGMWLATWLGGRFILLGGLIAIFVLFTIITSLLVSWYVYDGSNLYSLNWLGDLGQPKNIVNINAGFDETSSLLAIRFPKAKLRVFDFYDPERHTEPAIKRARKVYPPYPGTELVTTSQLPLAAHSTDLIFLLFAAHEIRDPEERANFFGLLRETLKPDGKIIVVEHLRDTANYLAYSFGALHFVSDANWQLTFSSAGFEDVTKTRINPFVVKYTLSPNAATS